VSANANADVVIIGGGMVGACLAALLARRGIVPAERLVLVESRLPSRPATDGDIDLRVSAVSRSSERILRACGAWTAIGCARSCAYQRMCVWDESARPGETGAIEFDCASLGEPSLGHIVENRRIQWELLQQARAAGVRVVQSQVRGLQRTARSLGVELADGLRIEAALVVAADGADSPARRLMGIGTRRHAHDQQAVVSHVATGESHRFTAWQRFLDTGPIALLPLHDGRSSIVWTTTPPAAASLLALGEAEFCAAVERAADGVLGRVAGCGPRASFPLQSSYAESYVVPRFALVGDAAHSVHPLAGQGVNLGFLDCAALAEIVAAAREKGDDAGDLRGLRRYERWRKGENLLMLAALDGLNRLFSNANPMVGAIRRAGLTLVNRAEPVKTLFMKRAMGLAGDLPRLALVDG
jgi:2-octaprenylphenol hydroxylase